MTLCIAAHAKIPSPLTKCIVLCFDRKVANDAWGSESEYKFHVLSEELVALAAGAPGKAKELALLYEAYLKTINLSLAHAPQQLSKPLADFKKRKAELYIRQTLAVSYAEFRNHGEQWFGKDGFDKRMAAIEQHQPKIELILAGFIQDEPVIYRVTRADGTGPLTLDQSTNFSMIGSGSYTADPTLHTRGQTPNTPLSEAMYNIYEAKKRGESSPYVGQKTIMHILLPPKGGTKQIRANTVTEEGEKFLKKLHRRYGPKTMKMWPLIPYGVLEPAVFRWP